MLMKTKKLILLTAFIFLTTTATATYSLTVTAENSDGELVTADSICVNGNCVQREFSHTFNVPENQDATIYIEDSEYQNLEDSEYIFADMEKTYVLQRSDQETDQKVDLTIEAVNQEGEYVKADKICVNSKCVQREFRSTFSVTKNQDATVIIEDSEYENLEQTEYIFAETTKTYELHNNAPTVSLQRPSDGASIELPYTLNWSTSDPDSDSVENTVYIGKDRSDVSTLDEKYLIRRNVGDSESFRVLQSDLTKGDYIWGVKAEDEHGATTFSKVRGFTAQHKTKKDGRSSLMVFVQDNNGKPIRGAEVMLDDPNRLYDFTDRTGETRRFELEKGVYEVTVSRSGYETRRTNVNLSAGEDEYLPVTLRSKTGRPKPTPRLANLYVHVEDGGNDDLEDARVRVRNGDHRVRYTDRYGDADFQLRSDNYNVRVTCNGESRSRNVDLSEGDSESIDIEFSEDFDSNFCEEDDDVEGPDDEEKGLAITDVSYPSSVCRGSSFSADVEIENRGGFHELVTVTGSGLGSINIGEHFALDIAETKTHSVRFTNVQGSGAEEFEITVTNHDNDKATRTINVRDCGAAFPDDRVPTGVTAEVSPKRTVVGKAVKVKGYVDGVRGRSQVTITANGERKARISTEPDGYYSTHIRVDEIGDNIINVRSGQSETSAVVEAVPVSAISGISAPEKVFESESFEVCSDVESQIEPKVFLMRDGEVVDSKFASGEVCFQTETSNTGEYTYQIRTLTYGQEGSGPATTVKVLDLGSEVTNFPSQVATTESEEGMVKVELYNTRDETRRYKVKLNGIRTDWLSQSQEEVFLTKGERETVYFYITPTEEGQYEPIVTVVSEDTTIYSDQVDVWAGGTKKPKKTSVMERLAEIFQL